MAVSGYVEILVAIVAVTHAGCLWQVLIWRAQAL